MSILRSRYVQILIICAGFLFLVALVHGGPECESLGGDCAGSSGWDPMQKLDEIGTGKYDQVQASGGVKWPEKSRTMRWNKTAYGLDDNETQAPVEAKSVKEESKPAEAKIEASEQPTVRSEQFKMMLVPIEDINDADILIDVSENATEYIKGAVLIPYADFLQDTNLKSIPEVTKILGDAGISQNDSVVIYGECLPCGGGPAASTYVYWMMKSLGHDKVWVMDGTIDDWKARGLPTTKESTIRPAVNYTPRFTPAFIASYEYVKSGSPQIVDARTIEEFGAGSIPGAINIPYDMVLKDGKNIRDEAYLEKVFAVLSKDRPVVVYTNTGIKASVVWFALGLVGYDAKLYSWQDWLANEAPRGNAST